MDLSDSHKGFDFECATIRCSDLLLESGPIAGPLNVKCLFLPALFTHIYREIYLSVSLFVMFNC